ncbi:transglutaminase-like domain-containing protein [Actinomyces bowdenii]|uniref:Transglutaminase-like domain-containing protein n=1 Tax=Actinomyces bowdenii TaxID=131109 RepID=A0A3P1V9E9_9ACTO|nr:transglutaminase-like domain-containing protein [Actinomyces bowdenii]RRD30854.1 hypothetical protein EII10_01785 [Actinomyces bowdenii]
MSRDAAIRPRSARRSPGPGAAVPRAPRRAAGGPAPARLRAQEAGNRVMSAPGRLEPLLAALLLTALWWMGLSSLTGLLAAGPWLHQALAVCAAAVLTTGVGRCLWPQRALLMILAGLAAGAGAVAWAGRAGPFPEMWWHEPSGALAAVRAQISEGVPPLAPAPALASLLLLSCLLLSWTSAVLSAGGGDAIAVSGLLPAGLLLLPALFLSTTPTTAILIAVSACLLGLVSISAPARYWPARGHGPGSAHGPRVLRRLSALAMGLAALALGGGLISSAPTTPDHVWNPEGASSTIPDLSVGLSRDLVRGSNATAFSYTGQADEGESMRFTLGVITSLEGEVWQPDATAEDLAVDQLRTGDAPSTLTAGGAASASGLDAERVRESLGALTLTTQGLRTDRLPTLQSTALVAQPVTTPDSLPPGAQVQAPDLGQWRWVQGSSTAVAGTAPLNPGSTYSLLGWSAVADAQGRPRAPVPLPPAPPDPQALDAYTALPEHTPPAIAAFAQETVSQAGTDRASQAAALVARLRGPDFTYDESAPYAQGTTAMASIEAFLSARSGYCVHYASAFTVMARSQGIPTRIAVGYASRSTGPGQWTAVTGHQLHAWPEVWLDDAGWVAFEPTPGGAGLAADEGTTTPGGASPAPATSPAGGAAPSARPGPSASAAGEPGAGPSASTTPEGSQSAAEAGPAARPAGPAMALAAVLAVLAAPALARRARRGRRLARVRSGDRPAQAAWDELLATARDLGLPTGGSPRATTEEAVEEALAQAVRAAEGPRAGPGDAGREAIRALRALRQAVVAERYGPPGRAGAPAEALLTALEACAPALGAAAGRSRRLVAVLAPASLIPASPRLGGRAPRGPG